MSTCTSNTFCILPWMHVALNSSGYVRLCCNSIPGKNIVLDDSGKKMHAKSLSNVEDLAHNRWLTNIREKMLKGEKIDICQRCYREEESGLRSARQGWNTKFDNKVRKLKEDAKSKDISSSFESIYLDLRLGNLCNLKCRMCNPYASKKWLEDWNAVHDEKISDKEIMRLDRLDWYNNEETWQNLIRFVDQAEEIYFTGGEPFLIFPQTRMLDYLVSSGRASKVRLKYNTNLTVLPTKITKYWSNFKSVLVNVSIDGKGSLNDYIRSPSKWDQICYNLQALDSLAGRIPSIQVAVHTTVQVYNLNNIIPLIEHLQSYKYMNKVPYFNILNHPGYLNIRVLPDRVKNLYYQRLLNWVSSNRARFTEPADLESFDKLLGLKYYMSESWTELLGEFKEKTLRLDEQRSESLKQCNPELFQHLWIDEVSL